MNGSLEPKKSEINPGRRKFVKAAGLVIVGTAAGYVVGPTLSTVAKRIFEGKIQQRDVGLTPDRVGMIRENETDIAIATPRARKFIAENAKKINFNYATGLLKVKASLSEGGPEVEFIRDTVALADLKEILVDTDKDLKTVYFYYLYNGGKNNVVIILRKINDSADSKFEYDSSPL